MVRKSFDDELSSLHHEVIRMGSAELCETSEFLAE